MSEPGPEVMARFVGAENVERGREYLAGFPNAWNALATMKAALERVDEADGERDG